MRTKLVRCSNSSVTDFYLDVIQSACEQIESDACYTITARFKDELKAKLRGEKTILWIQGISAEEHYMRYHNRFKMILIDILTKLAIKQSSFVIFCSDYMKEHFEKKYHMTVLDKKSYVMPCFNTTLKENAFWGENKYKNNVFTYIGSMEKWQGFDQVLAYYKKAESLGLKNIKFEIYTPDKEKAQEKVDAAGIANYSIGFCKNDDLPTVLKNVKYGFILREDNEVNRVATPTKISTYLSCGVIPIYSKCLRSFDEQAKKMSYVVEQEQFDNRLLQQEMTDISPEAVLNEYRQVFDTYYSTEYHKGIIKQKLSKIVNVK